MTRLVMRPTKKLPWWYRLYFRWKTGLKLVDIIEMPPRGPTPEQLKRRKLRKRERQAKRRNRMARAR